MQIGDTLGGLFSPEMFAAMEQAVSPEAAPEEVVKAKKKGYQPNEKLLGAAAEIIGQPPTKADFAYITTELVQCSFPQRDPGDIPAWIRRNGDFTLIIQPGIDPATGQSLGLPSGETPRIFLPWAFKEMYVKKTSEVDLPDTQNEFIRSMGGEEKPGRGKRGSLKLIKDQLIKLAACKISLHHHQGNNQRGGLANLNVPLTRASVFWWDLKNPDQKSLFKSKIVFDDLIYQSILDRHIPIDYRVLIALKRSLNQSSFAIDVYKWWKYRLNGMKRKNKAEIYIRLEYLMQHFGTRYTRVDNFRAAFREALLNVQQICPELDFEFVGPYFVLKNPRLVTGQIATLERPALMPPHLTVSDKTRSRFVRAFPDHDVELALAAFYKWLPTAKADPGNVNAFFWTFAETWARNNPPERVFI